MPKRHHMISESSSNTTSFSYFFQFPNTRLFFIFFSTIRFYNTILSLSTFRNGITLFSLSLIPSSFYLFFCSSLEQNSPILDKQSRLYRRLRCRSEVSHFQPSLRR